MVITRDNLLDQNNCLNIENYCFEKVESYKPLGAEINSRNNYHEKIRLQNKAGNRCYFVL